MLVAEWIDAGLVAVEDVGFRELVNDVLHETTNHAIGNVQVSMRCSCNFQPEHVHVLRIHTDVLKPPCLGNNALVSRNPARQ